MQNNYKIINAILWAAAIIAAALLGGSSFLTIIILPLLALMSISQSVYLTRNKSSTKPLNNDDTES